MARLRAGLSHSGRRIVHLALLSLLSSSGWGALVFAETRVTHEAGFDDVSFEAVFPFINEGDEPVEILQVHSSCGCTVPSLEKNRYEPGENGEITAVFEFGGRTGLQQKLIQVATDAGRHQLSLQVEIPVKWSMDRRALVWRGEDEREPQEVEIRFHYGLPLSIEAIEIDREHFGISHSWLQDGGKLLLQFTPTESADPGVYRAALKLRYAAGESLTLPVYLRVI